MFLKCEQQSRNKAVENGEIELIPKTYEREWKKWLENPVLVWVKVCLCGCVLLWFCVCLVFVLMFSLISVSSNVRVNEKLTPPKVLIVK